MTGAFTLSADPTSALQAATKQYVDTGLSAVVAQTSQYLPANGVTTTPGGNLQGNDVVTRSTPYVDPRAYGAKCDGVTDDYAAFAAAVSYASSIYGTVKSSVIHCYLSHSLTLGNASFVGPGRGPNQNGLIFAAGQAGIIVNGRGTSVTDVQIASKDTAATSGDHCVWVQGAAIYTTVARVDCEVFGDSQFFWDNTAANSNLDFASAHDLHAGAGYSHGFEWEAAQANINNFVGDNLHAQTNAGWGFYNNGGLGKTLNGTYAELNVKGGYYHNNINSDHWEMMGCEPGAGPTVTIDAQTYTSYFSMPRWAECTVTNAGAEGYTHQILTTMGNRIAQAYVTVGTPGGSNSYSLTESNGNLSISKDGLANQATVYHHATNTWTVNGSKQILGTPTSTTLPSSTTLQVGEVNCQGVYPDDQGQCILSAGGGSNAQYRGWMMVHGYGSAPILFGQGGTQFAQFDSNGNFTANGNVAAGAGSNVIYRCTTAGTLPVGALTTNTANCGASTDTGLRGK